MTAQVLLRSDQGEGAIKKWTDEQISTALNLHRNASKIKLLGAHLHTHKIASESEVPASVAHRLAGKLELDHRPGNRSWLNVAEIELSVLAQQCLQRRIPSAAKLCAELTAWQIEFNCTASKVVWHFTTQDARVKFQPFYPVFEPDEISNFNATF